MKRRNRLHITSLAVGLFLHLGSHILDTLQTFHTLCGSKVVKGDNTKSSTDCILIFYIKDASKI